MLYKDIRKEALQAKCAEALQKIKAVTDSDSPDDCVIKIEKISRILDGVIIYPSVSDSGSGQT